MPEAMPRTHTTTDLEALLIRPVQTDAAEAHVADGGLHHALLRGVKLLFVRSVVDSSVGVGWLVAVRSHGSGCVEGEGGRRSFKRVCKHTGWKTDLGPLGGRGLDGHHGVVQGTALPDLFGGVWLYRRGVSSGKANIRVWMDGSANQLTNPPIPGLQCHA